MSSTNIQRVIESIVSQDRFNGTAIKTQIIPLFEKVKYIQSLKEKLTEKQFEFIICAIVRNIFLIELVNDQISSTKMEVRWIVKPSEGKKQEVFDQTDPRFATFDECVLIFEKLTSELNKILDDKKINLLYKYQEHKLIPYELPIDYIQKNISKLHSVQNMEWFWNEDYENIIRLRSILITLNDYSEIFTKILKEKIKVKTYLTDRVQTGKHKTNREKRWEAHPDSVHFALRKDCLLIEKELISQILNFEKCPVQIISSTENLVIKTDTYCCPVTLNQLDFHRFVSEILNPTHGVSKFQVGHLNPLKSNSTDGKNTHAAQNIGWISDDGNRIQGSMSLSRVRELLLEISKNYDKIESKN